MPVPINSFKERLAAGEKLFGCWLSLAEPCATEIVSSAGFDWVLIDGEHAPNHIRSMRDQLLAVAGSSSHPIIRIPVGDARLIKQVLDLGVQTLLVPIVESAEQARHLVRACHYPPKGVRGVGAAAARASRYGDIADYIATADEQICLLVQVETCAGIEALDDILAVNGIDGVFIGPADLSTDMGHVGDTYHPEVRATILDAIGRIKQMSKAAGILSTHAEATSLYLDAGAQFVAVALDALLLAESARRVASNWQNR
ncbi:MAG: HpcH/HpaI aldolase/citrate lyase family protein [Aestuariivita sp.]|nr:HpcH/HpaI aldolase/citrate lyase family protein [Aestuariivita sp.]MCY4201912.1 HpcH/HpaI aldolase/citrate lyase family protein [Aestuariivita sp.]